ncbi:MAG: hypothetical protein LBE01_05030 [Deltaproteobacteria bacterium]|jgi:hypothetical protein|nr:hypothetical protein [Deltaproteobacteria bacterium]
MRTRLFPFSLFASLNFNRLAEALRNVPRGLTIIVALAIFAGGLYFGFQRLADPIRSATDLLTVVDLIPNTVEAEVGGLGTPDYNRLIEEQNAANAEAAAQDGSSFVPTPVGLALGRPALASEAAPLSPAFDAERPARPPLPVKVAPAPHGRPVEPEPAPALPLEPSLGFDLKKAIQLDLKSILAGSAGPLSAPTVAIPEAKALSSAQEEARPTALGPALRPGDLLAASLTLAVDSDVPTPALAAVTLGPLKGAKLLGKFDKGETGAVLTFNRLIPVDGPALALEALAVDPKTSKAAIASRVDSHFFQRWGGLLASGFLEGFGTALGDRGGRVYSNGEILFEDRPEKTVADASLEALGQVGRAAGEQFRKGFDRPPTVHVNAGQPLGILILSVGQPLGPSTFK